MNFDKHFSYECHTQMGKQSIETFLKHVNIKSIHSREQSLQCFHCGGNTHSQHQCPKRFCKTCKQFGHSDKQCKFQS